MGSWLADLSFRLCLCRDLYRDHHPFGGTILLQTQLRQPIKVAVKVRDHGCRLGRNTG